MEEEEGEVCSTPFWEQSSTNRRRDRIRSLSSLFLNSGLLIFLLCLTALVFAFFVIPSIVQSLRPTVLVKKSWDSVNLVLVLSALVFGLLSRNRNREYDETNRNFTSPRVTSEIQKSNPSTPRQQWYEYDDRTVYNSSSAVNGGGLRRNSCSYPDLPDASPWINADDRWRFSDDLLVEAHRHSDSDRFRRRRSWKRVFEEEEEQAAPVTRVEEDSYTPPPPPSPPAPPAITINRKPTRAYESVARREQVKGSEPAKTVAPQAATAPVPPPAPVDSEEKKSSKSDRKRSGPNATKDLFTSIYNQKSNKKKKKQRQKSVENFETLIQPQAPPPPPPPPPPPSPPSALRNLLSSQKGKGKKIITVPPSSSTARASRSTAIVPLKTSNFVRTAENSNSGGESPLTGCESPLIPIPPPPPPPPFKMPSWRFVVRGDYVRVGSMDSSRSGSPEDSPASTPTAAGGGEAAAAGQLFCPSPDVDTKADMFIAKFWAGLKLQKMNSMARQKQGLGLSNLGPDG